MSKKNPYSNHPSNPAAQPFNVRGKPSTKQGWWKRGSNNNHKGQQ